VPITKKLRCILSIVTLSVQLAITQATVIQITSQQLSHIYYHTDKEVCLVVGHVAYNCFIQNFSPFFHLRQEYKIK